VCHIHAAKLVFRGLPNEAATCMPTETADNQQLLEALRERASELEVSWSAEEAADPVALRSLVHASVAAAESRQYNAGAAAPAVSVTQFVPVPMNVVGPEYDRKGLAVMLSELKDAAGYRVLCEAVGCPLDDGSNPAHEQFWVAEFKLSSPEDARVTYVPLRSVELPEVQPEFEDPETAAFFRNARAVAEQMARVRAVNTIVSWWFWLWSDDLVWTVHTQKVAESQEGQALLADMLGSAPTSPTSYSRSEEPVEVMSELDDAKGWFKG